MNSADRDGRRRRDLSEEEHALWTTVTRSVPRLRKRKTDTAAETAGEAAPLLGRTKAGKASRPAKPAAIAKTAPAPPTLAPLERRLKQRLTRGTQAIDARLDLHGLRESEAHSALLHFLRASQGKGAKVVLIITGKGRLGREHGVLRRAVPLWLRLPEFRHMVVGFESAGIGHGGEGALYVRVRKLRG